ncbi:unnamed protein product [Vitrella brassicaformis CCMP3155]|uniref:Calponin-homology (CH) domain-containing protein n=1 Tax=Vitrella brassicaformis (strain CCMP3155) TaxID=1169540 RepID=A0A0G4EVE6_VITBC|nr:unnamed protein product [Vitrella brassicaformis CCMP3155]|mmetsp:Transcript_26150/g.75054  ORF Transcript_26150/g.75054 Transcript_26150/m.75054 type:complete len:346 (-) Transcript_26150:212-1249(-)|eukprot:CEM02240.1 unnamed protein product [Vitrella brassicaformis CCMP3155]
MSVAASSVVGGAGLGALNPDDQEDLQRLYNWVDEIPLSRPKKNISRDFADGVLMAEVVSHLFPKLVELHNYSAANSVAKKVYNWNTLNQRVFKKMGFQLESTDVDDVVNAKPYTIEKILRQFQIMSDVYRVRVATRQTMEPTSGHMPGLPSSMQQQPPSPPIHTSPPHQPVAPAAPSRPTRPDGTRATRHQPQTRVAAPPQQQQARAQEGRPTHGVSVEERSSARGVGGGAGAAGGVPSHPRSAGSRPAPTGGPFKDRSSHGASRRREPMGQTDYEEIIAEKDVLISDLKETVHILNEKIHNLEKLIRVKDAKIQALGQARHMTGVPAQPQQPSAAYPPYRSNLR